MHANPTTHPHLYAAWFFVGLARPRYWRKRP